MKIGILGTGRIAGTVAPALVGLPEIECYACASRTPGKAEAFAEKYGFQKVFTSYEAMLEDPQVELVYVATPHSHHVTTDIPDVIPILRLSYDSGSEHIVRFISQSGKDGSILLLDDLI